MTPEQKAALLPSSKVLFELWNALIFHLFERNSVDPTRIAALLEERQNLHKTDDQVVALMMQASIDWLKTLRAGEVMPPSILH
jgi:hypothetical protein